MSAVMLEPARRHFHVLWSSSWRIIDSTHGLKFRVFYFRVENWAFKET